MKIGISVKKPSLLRIMRTDIQTVLERDPAARTRIEVLLTYPGLHALWSHRFSHFLWNRGSRLFARILSNITRCLTGIEIHPAAKIGSSFFIDHGMGVVIGETAIIGKDVTLYHGVTLGGTSLEKKKRHPTIGDRVTIGAGAKILGDISIGDDSRIGANAVVVKNVPPNSVVVGIPGQVIRRNIPHTAQDKPDLHHERIPDVIGQRISELMQRVSALEEALSAIQIKGIIEERTGDEEGQPDPIEHGAP
ncbi:MAG TPA: serine O-acetyltransferase [Rectinema sp.]|jgi:serine O-acetyltransferase|nr:serine O-acetyltransferase [Spirochaetaceae bacterium]HNV18100.1 serine O-acetyltransferase [Rectinema sp.]HNY98958.1 serine O-acetyltransferase [Rectinema sp.]HOD58100.1 serine O-acetyltransferase [Rectinema sp.]HOE75912.1 serine O-acetyltransferase [Rectinema sp.]